MAVDVHRDRNRGVPQLFLHIARALMRHQQQRGVSVAQVMRVSNFKTGIFADFFDLPLDLALAVGPFPGFARIDKEQINTSPLSGPQILFFSESEEILKLDT